MTLPDCFQDVNDLRMEPLDSARLLAFYRNTGFKDMERRITERLKLSHKYVSVKTVADKTTNTAITNTRRERWSGDSFKPLKEFSLPPKDSFDDVPF